MSEDNTGKLAWFFAGAAIGAAIALLYAPASGEETRKMIGDAASRGKDRLSETGRDLYDRGRRLADDASGLIESGRKLVQG